MLRPADIDFRHLVPGRVSGYIFGIIASNYSDGGIIASGCMSLAPVDPEKPIGHFRADIVEGGGRRRTLFVRISSPWPPAKSRMIASASAYLASKGIGCEEWIPRVDGKGPFIVDTKTFSVPVQFSLARFEDLKVIGTGRQELRELGTQIGRLHKFLKKMPLAASVKRRSAMRSRELSGVLSRLKKAVRTRDLRQGFSDRAGWIHKNRVFIDNLLREYRPDFRLSGDLRCQVVHGDLNVGNVLRSGKGIVFLDFEEMDHSYLPALADIAMAVERFIIFDEPGKGLLRDRMSSFIRAYMRETDSPFSRRAGIPAGGQIAAMIRQLDYHAVCVLLSMNEDERRAFPEEEWDKFILLESRSRRIETD